MATYKNYVSLLLILPPPPPNKASLPPPPLTCAFFQARGNSAGEWSEIEAKIWSRGLVL